MPSPYGTSEHLEQIWREMSDVETAAANALIPIAAAMVRGRIPDLDARLDDARLDETVLAYRIEVMVQRVLVGRVAPEGVASRSKSLDTYTESVTYAPGELAADLEVTDADMAVLAPDTVVTTSTRGSAATLAVKPTRWSSSC